eukprot:6430283-Pyramimonas_sp.AAC.1
MANVAGAGSPVDYLARAPKGGIFAPRENRASSDRLASCQRQASCSRCSGGGSAADVTIAEAPYNSRGAFPADRFVAAHVR